MYTYNKDAETGLCNRHQQVEIIISVILCIIIRIINMQLDLIIVILCTIIINIINIIRRSAESSSLATLFQGEIVKFSDYQKTELGTEVEVNFHILLLSRFSTSCLIFASFPGGVHLSRGALLSTSRLACSSLVWPLIRQPAAPEQTLPSAQRGAPCLPHPRAKGSPSPRGGRPTPSSSS